MPKMYAIPQLLSVPTTTSLSAQPRYVAKDLDRPPFTFPVIGRSAQFAIIVLIALQLPWVLYTAANDHCVRLLTWCRFSHVFRQINAAVCKVSWSSIPLGEVQGPVLPRYSWSVSQWTMARNQSCSLLSTRRPRSLRPLWSRITLS